MPRHARDYVECRNRAEHRPVVFTAIAVNKVTGEYDWVNPVVWAHEPHGPRHRTPDRDPKAADR